MRKKQLTMQQGLALGCLILVVCAVLFGIVLRATRAHDLEDPEKVAAAICDLPTDFREDADAKVEMLDISTAVEQLFLHAKMGNKTSRGRFSVYR